MFYTIRMPINLKTLLFYRPSAIVSAAVLQMGAFALAREPIMNSTMKRGKNLQRPLRALEPAKNNAANVTVESSKRLPDKDKGQLAFCFDAFSWTANRNPLRSKTL
jgi:hypothetical protein